MCVCVLLTKRGGKQVLRPIGRLGGISYCRVTEAIELQRPDFVKDMGGIEGFEKVKNKQRN